MGEGLIASHGSQEMAVWGPNFQQVKMDVDRGPVRWERSDGTFSNLLHQVPTRIVLGGTKKSRSEESELRRLTTTPATRSLVKGS